MIWYILICSMIGGLSVSVTTGLGSAIVTSVKGDNQVRALVTVNSVQQVSLSSLQFKYWFTYFLLVFVVITLRKSFREATWYESVTNASQSRKYITSTLRWRCLIPVSFIFPAISYI